MKRKKGKNKSKKNTWIKFSEIGMKNKRKQKFNLKKEKHGRKEGSKKKINKKAKRKLKRKRGMIKAKKENYVIKKREIGKQG